MPLQRWCAVCGNGFSIKPYQVSRNVRFCSRQCHGKSKRQSVEDRLWAKVKKGPGCWLWIGDTNEHGYGRVWISDSPRKFTYAHRLAFELTVGPIPDGKSVLHSCDTPPCVRPDHLRLGTQQENNADRDSRDRVRHGSRHANSKLTEARVREMRLLYATGAISHRKLAKAFDVSHQTVADILSGRIWART